MKNFDKFVTIFAMFGCWFKQFNTNFTDVIYSIWMVLILFWMLINFVGIFDSFTDKKTSKKIAKSLTNETALRWVMLNLLALISFLCCGEYIISLAFLCSSCGFMCITLYDRDKSIKKK